MITVGSAISLAVVAALAALIGVGIGSKIESRATDVARDQVHLLKQQLAHANDTLARERDIQRVERAEREKERKANGAG